ncbi:restriction endonuclease subunit S [Paenibacillus sp. FSL K6-1230]|uniref:restriction endonuclease subunit S n=1 Tax=Paenibacillus sp. FSL K6-1230 TaxID=2921603 RepID=UPI0030FA489C
MIKYKLGDVVKVISERVDNPANSEYDKFVGLEHYVSSEIEIKKYGDTSLLKSAMKVFKSGDILIARRNVYLKRASIVKFDGITSGDSIVLRVEDKLLQRIIPFILNTDEFWAYAEKFSDGTMSKRLSPKVLLEYEFMLPQIEQLEKLADLLWAANDTKEAYKKLLLLTDELVKSQFIEMFGDPVENPMGWVETALGDVAEIKIGPFGTLLHKEDYIENGHAVVNPSHIIDGKICIDPKLTISDRKYNELASYQLKIGDVVLGRRGEMGRCAVVYEEGLLCGTGSMIIRAGHQMKPFFLHHILSSPKYKKIIEDKAVGVTMMNLNVPIVSSLRIPLLPINLQEQFISLMEQANKSKLELKQNINSLETTIKVLMSRNFG